MHSCNPLQDVDAVLGAGKVAPLAHAKSLRGICESGAHACKCSRIKPAEISHHAAALLCRRAFRDLFADRTKLWCGLGCSQLQLVWITREFNTFCLSDEFAQCAPQDRFSFFFPC